VFEGKVLDDVYEYTPLAPLEFETALSGGLFTVAPPSGLGAGFE
jgi:hypothetical protein